MDNSKKESGYNYAVASLVLGICAVALFFFGFSAIASVVLGVIGLVLAKKSKEAGFDGTMRTVGFALNLAGCVVGTVIFFSVLLAMFGIANILSLFADNI